MYEPSTGDWVLLVEWVQERDGGVYECQIGTTPPRSHFVTLHVVGKYSTTSHHSYTLSTPLYFTSLHVTPFPLNLVEFEAVQFKLADKLLPVPPCDACHWPPGDVNK